MGMLGEDTLLGSGEGRLHQPPSHVAGHLSAMRSAFAGMSSGRLPPHLLFSERDFNENDYEALLALDDTVENRKGQARFTTTCPTSCASLLCDLSLSEFCFSTCCYAEQTCRSCQARFPLGSRLPSCQDVGHSCRIVYTGASKDIIEAIPTVAVPLNGLTDTGDKRCPICLEDYVSGVTLRRLHCSHQFHKPCVDTWLGQKATCPICQGDCKTGCSA